MDLTPGRPNIPGIFTKMSIAVMVTVRGLPRWGLKPDQPPGSLCALLVQEKNIILEEGNQPYPRFPKCNMFVSHKYLNGWHFTNTFCRRGEERNRWRRRGWGHRK